MSSFGIARGEHRWRTNVVFKDFASNFQEKIEDKRRKLASARLPVNTQADFAYPKARSWGARTGTLARTEGE
jgi:hypothetical protein